MSPQQEAGVRRFVRGMRKLSLSDLQRLRREAGQPRGCDVHVDSLFNDIWRTVRHRYTGTPRRACWLASTLYPWNLRRLDSGARTPRNVGEGYRRAVEHRGPGALERNRLERRFLALLDAHGPQLEAGLLDAVRFLEREEVPVDWERLALHLADWEAPGRPVQDRWFRSFRGMREAAGKGE